MEEIIQKFVTTVEGDTISIDKFDIGNYINIPLKSIKRFEYCEIFERNIPIYFIQVFEKKIEFYQESSDSEKVVFISWIGREIK